MDKARRRHHRRRANPAKVALIILAILLFVLIVAGCSAWYLWKHSAILNKETMFRPQQAADYGAPTPAPSPTPEPAPDGPAAPESYELYVEGKYYKRKENVVSTLFMGIDSPKNESTDSEIVSTANQSDVLLLGVFDTETGGMKVLHIPRDTEADVKVFDMTKTYVNTQRKHICLQHVYGDGGQMSCELTMDAVSNLLFGAPIYRYVSLGTNGIAKAVNTLGGVELTMLDDFSFYSSGMKKGETVKLNGKRALVYIRSRSNRGLDGTDASRMKRQEQFISAFVSKVKSAAKENPAILLSLYDATKDYMQTNLSIEEFMLLANMGVDAGFSAENLVNLPGTVGDEAQPFFHMDEAAARAVILDLFYEEIPLS